MSFIERIAEANRCRPEGFRPFRVAGQRVGFVRHALVGELRRWPQVFRVADNEVRLATALDRAEASPAARSAALAEVLAQLRVEGWLGDHWWDEAYAVNRYFAEPPCMVIERAAVQPFGVCGYGVHVNGYVRAPDGLRMWLGRRARNKPTAPGKLDQMVAGGQPAGVGLLDNVVKECAEEAAIPESLARQAYPAGAVSYCLETSTGLRPDVLYVFDLELPADYVPRNADGEVDEFYLWPIEQVAAIVRHSTEFKFNCALVVIDFLIRHGVLAPEHPDYLALLAGLRRREQMLARFPG